MDCEQIREYYYAIISENRVAVPSAVREHLRQCAGCRSELMRLRDSLASETTAPPTHTHLALHFQWLGRWVDCKTVQRFLPLLATASLPVCCRTPITAHLDACAACSAELKELLRLSLSDAELVAVARWLADGSGVVPSQAALSAMKRRPSGVATCAFFADADAQALTVQTRRIGPMAMSAVFGSRFKLAVSGLAAALLLAVLLVFQPMRAEALDLRQFYEALAEVRNIAIETTAPEEEAPLQHIWVSQSLGLRIVESSEKRMLYNLNQRAAWERRDDDMTLHVSADALTPPEFLQPPWGLLPFRSITRLPEGVQWRSVRTGGNGATAVYELLWTERISGGRVLHKKWRGTLDRQTYLPETIQWFQRFDNDADYVLMMTMTMAYPDDERFIEVLNERGYGDQINILTESSLGRFACR